MLIQLVRIVALMIQSQLKHWSLVKSIYLHFYFCLYWRFRIFTQFHLVLLHSSSMKMPIVCFCAISFWVMLRLHINRIKVENENNDRPTEWVRVSILFWVLLAFLTVKHGYIHFAMNGIYNKISTIYPRKREYRPIKIFHLNFANCFGLLFHNILVGFIWYCATKSAGCVFTVYHIYILSLYGETVVDRIIFRVFHLFLLFFTFVCMLFKTPPLASSHNLLFVRTRCHLNIKCSTQI